MDEILIASVLKREALWNPANELHKNAQVLRTLWQEIAVDIQRDVKTIKARWKNLRAYFMREHAKIERSKIGNNRSRRSTWPNYEHLMFLLNTTNHPRENSERDSNLNEVSEDTDDMPLVIDEDDHPSSVQTNSDLDTISNHSHTSQTCQQSNEDPHRKINRMVRSENNGQLTEKRKSKVLQKKIAKEKNYDYIFFQSLLPYMAHIPLSRKLRLRSKIQDLISTEIEAYGNIGRAERPTANENNRLAETFPAYENNRPTEGLSAKESNGPTETLPDRICMQEEEQIRDIKFNIIQQ